MISLPTLSLPFLTQTLIIFLASVLGLTFLFTLFFLFEFWHKKQVSKQPPSISPEGEESIELVHQAIKKSEAILSQAELQALKIASASKFNTHKLEQQYVAKFDEILGQYDQQLNQMSSFFHQRLQNIEREFLTFLNTLRSRTENIETASQDLTKQRINQLFEQFETRLSDFLIQTEQKSVNTIELELRAARQLIETYKIKQLELIDENIIAMMEKTLSLVLNKKLSLKEQIDLVYESLEKAKTEKFIA